MIINLYYVQEELVKIHIVFGKHYYVILYSTSPYYSPSMVTSEAEAPTALELVNLSQNDVLDDLQNPNKNSLGT